ncbi:solute carrier family 10 (sodium/bile acid cotransporter), member 7 [Entomortierella parvispora]|uniref:Solute carrier family 10 (Sodium/bile acid cotransporter), member 7 n=1 Tax=Entomortierella parvispora TaxID=205924 RepID=A0A9P3M052_9FUNG|nr:solute carrier family 10 (sodium/bile acid cotransporter), member 7 [Entomortierella parvispora]
MDYTTADIEPSPSQQSEQQHHAAVSTEKVEDPSTQSPHRPSPEVPALSEKKIIVIDDLSSIPPTKHTSPTSVVSSRSTLSSSSATMASDPVKAESFLPDPPTPEEKAAAPQETEREDKKARAKRRRAFWWGLWMQNWFLLGLAFVIIMARFEPSWGKTGGPIRPEYSVKYGATACIFLLSGLSLKTQDILQSAKNYRAHMIVQLTSFVLIPLFVKALTTLIGLSSFDSNLLAGMAFTAATPTTISSNVVMTGNAGGSEPLALFNATLGNLLGVFLSPVITLLILSNTPQTPADAGGGIEYGEILLNLGTTIVLPVIVGQIMLYCIPRAIAWAKSKVHFPTLNSTCLLILVWSIFCDAFSNGTFDGVTAGQIIAVGVCQGSTFWLATFFLAFVSRVRPKNIRILHIMDKKQQRKMAASKDQEGQDDELSDMEAASDAVSLADAHPCTEGLQLPRSRLQQLAEPMTKKDTVAILFCGATKSVAIGIPLVKLMYPAKSGTDHLAGLMATPLLMYHVEQLFSGAIMVRVLKRWVDRGEETLDTFDKTPSDSK